MEKAYLNIHTDQGFTLIEVLVSMLLMSMVMMLIYNTLNFSASALNRGVRQSAMNEDISLTQNLIRNTIENTIPTRSSFTGSPSKMSFVTNLSKNGHRELPFEIELVEEDNALVMLWKNLEKRDDQGKVVLSVNVSDIEFNYGAKDIFETNQWSSYWETEDHPAFVKIRLENDEFWPEMVVDLNLTHTLDCWYDPVSRECQYR